MSVVMNEIERRKELLDSYEAKIEKSIRLKAEAEQLDKEIAATDVVEIKREIEELTEDAITLGYIKVEEPELPEVVEETEETVEEDLSERATNVLTSV